MISNSKVSKGFQTAIPAKIRKKLEVKAGDYLRWNLSENDVLTIEFMKKPTFEDIFGIIEDSDNLDAVQIKKRIQKGEKY